MRAPVFAALMVCCACPSEPKLDPKLEADGHYLAGTSAYLKGDFEEARTHFAEVKRINPTDPRLPAAMGELASAEGNLAEAIAAFEEAAQLDPKRATNWSRLAALYALKSEPDKADSAVKKALALNARDFDALEVAAGLAMKGGALDEAVKNWVLASQSAPAANRVALVQKATAALMKANRQADALVVLEGAKARGLVNADLQSELGNRLVEAKRLDEAIAAYSEAAGLNAKDPTLWELVGELESTQGRLERAVEAFHRSLKVQDRGVVHVALARVCQKTHDEACVQRELDSALQTASGQEPRELIDLAELIVSLGRKKDALVLLKPLSEEPDQRKNAQLQLRVAQLARQLKETDVVVAACLRALSAGAARCP